VVPVNTLITYVQLGVNTLLGIATVSSLVLIMLVFMLLEAARMPDKVKEAFGGRDLSNEYFKKIADDTWNYMKIKTVVCFLTGLFTFFGLWFLGVEYALLWGLLMFFLNYIPSIGQVIASVPPILLALIDGGASLAIGVTVWLIIVNTFFGIGIEPRYMGEGLGISSLVVLLSLIFWGWLLGPIGMFLSAPLTMVMKIILQNDTKTKWIAVLLSNR
ncbi:MAG: AI-2E family transporter, partial [Planctomycetaceae bacterium]|nr:AI-2E family transporter [Planctomycetaceae bacterium]